MHQDELNGWKEIAAYIGRTVRTAQRWETVLRLPVRRIPGTGGEIIYALKSEIDKWKRDAATTRAGQTALAAADESETDDAHGNGKNSGDGARPPGGGPSAAVPGTSQATAVAPNRVARRFPWRLIIGLAVVASAVAAWRVWPTTFAPVVPGAQNMGLAKGGWPTFAHDVQRSNRSDLAGPGVGAAARLLHTSPLGFSHNGLTASLDTSALVATSSGLILFGTCGSVSAIDLSGRVWWRLPLADAPFQEGVAGFTITSDGSVLVVTQECPGTVSTRVNVYRLAPDTQLLKAVSKVGEMTHAPAVAPDGDWYVVSDTNLVRGFHRNSTEEVWKTDLPGFAHGAVALDSRNNLYVGTNGADYNQPSLWSLDPDELRLRWHVDVPSLTTTVVTDDDRVCGAGGGELHCYDTRKRELWHVRIGSVAGSLAPLASARSGTLYVRSVEGLVAVDRRGHLLWTKTVDAGPRLGPAPVVDRDENVFTTLGKEVRSYAPDGRLRWRVELPDPGVMIIAANGVLCVTSERRNLYAIESPKTDKGPPAAR